MTAPMSAPTALGHYPSFYRTFPPMRPKLRGHQLSGNRPQAATDLGPAGSSCCQRSVWLSGGPGLGFAATFDRKLRERYHARKNDEKASSSRSSATVAAVIVLIGGWAKVTSPMVGLRRPTRRSVQDRLVAVLIRPPSAGDELLSAVDVVRRPVRVSLIIMWTASPATPAGPMVRWMGSVARS